MPKFTVKSRIKMNHQVYEPGNLIELNKQQAKELAHAIGPLREESRPPTTVKLEKYIADRDLQIGGSEVKKGDIVELTPDQALEWNIRERA